MAVQRRQPLRQTGSLSPDARNVQDSVLEWITRQWGTRATPFGVPTAVKSSEYHAKLGELVLCDASSAALTVWLPPVSQQDVGAVVSVKDFVGSTNTITVRPGDALALIGAAGYVELSSWAGSSFVVLSPTTWGQM